MHLVPSFYCQFQNMILEPVLEAWAIDNAAINGV